MRFIVNRLLSPFAAVMALYKNGIFHLLVAMVINTVFCCYTNMKWWHHVLIIAFILLPFEGFVSNMIRGSGGEDNDNKKIDEQKKALDKKLDAYSLKVIDELGKLISDEQFKRIPKDSETMESMRNVIGLHYMLLEEPSETANNLREAIKAAEYTNKDYLKQFKILEEDSEMRLQRLKKFMKFKEKFK